METVQIRVEKTVEIKQNRILDSVQNPAAPAELCQTHLSRIG